MDRISLDAFVRRHALGADAIAVALMRTGLRPSLADWRAFVALACRAAGIGAVGAGMLFFVAANWQDYGVMGRFALLQGALLLCVAGAFWRPPPSLVGQAALILATMLVGGLLALFGQSYQTGADLYELFFTWALLTLPFTLAGVSGALWAVWFVVLNIGIAILLGSSGGNIFWQFVDGWHVDRLDLLMLPCLLNLAAALGCVRLGRTRFAAAAPVWLARFLAAIGMLDGTAAMLNLVAGVDWGPDRSSTNAVAGLVFIAVCIVMALGTWTRRKDVFPMALIAASWTAISTVWLARTMRFGDIGAFFLIAMWLIAASTVSGMLLMHWVRVWRLEATRTTSGAAA